MQPHIRASLVLGRCSTLRSPTQTHSVQNPPAAAPLGVAPGGGPHPVAAALTRCPFATSRSPLCARAYKGMGRPACARCKACAGPHGPLLPRRPICLLEAAAHGAGRGAFLARSRPGSSGGRFVLISLILKRPAAGPRRTPLPFLGARASASAVPTVAVEIVWPWPRRPPILVCWLGRFLGMCRGSITRAAKSPPAQPTATSGARHCTRHPASGVPLGGAALCVLHGAVRAVWRPCRAGPAAELCNGVAAAFFAAACCAVPALGKACSCTSWASPRSQAGQRPHPARARPVGPSTRSRVVAREPGGWQRAGSEQCLSEVRAKQTSLRTA
jgi:hypothetical protein